MHEFQRTGLTTAQFLALRSIAREPWNRHDGRLQWRFNGRWARLFEREGVRAPLESADGTGGHGGYGPVIEKALEAAYELQALGLVELATLRCCPGTSCHRNDRDEFRLTQRGQALLDKANAANSRSFLATPAPQAPTQPTRQCPVRWVRRVSTYLREHRAA